MESKNKKHFVLVHGSCHGAWCWYKVVSLLKQAGHVVTALDLSASGINSKHIDQIYSIQDYVQPLMQFLASLPQHESVILVGHSYGGLCISLAMDSFPEKILAGIYVNAYMPDCVDPPGTLVTELFKRLKGADFDSIIEIGGEDHGNLPISLSIGANDLEKIMYQYCPPEDLELAKMVLRPFKFLLKDLLTTPESILRESKYGSVDRFYVLGKGDEVMSEEFLLWNIQKYPPKATKYIDEAGHMPMLSKPKELALCLGAIADMY